MSRQSVYYRPYNLFCRTVLVKACLSSVCHEPMYLPGCDLFCRLPLVLLRIPAASNLTCADKYRAEMLRKEWHLLKIWLIPLIWDTFERRFYQQSISCISQIGCSRYSKKNQWKPTEEIATWQIHWRSTGSGVVMSKHCYNWWKEVEERCEVNLQSVLLKKAHI